MFSIYYYKIHLIFHWMKQLNWNAEFLNYKNTWNLSVMKEALELLGNPHKKLKNIIHVAGTNGKGSTVSFIKTILETAGFRVGVFTSPHLILFNERIYFNHRLITDEEIENCIEIIVDKYAKAGKNARQELTYFEIATLIAVMVFSQQELDYCIFEVGLGGRFDATNIFRGDVVNYNEDGENDKWKSPNLLASVITSISLDHQEKLGNSVVEIAKEKAGIIKAGVPVFTYNENQDVIDVFKKITMEKKCKFYYPLLKSNGGNFLLDTKLKPSLLGKHQICNATLASEVCKYLNIDYTTIKKGVATTCWSGRIEKVSIIGLKYNEYELESFVDGAHNEDGIQKLCDFVESCFQNDDTINIIGVFACLKRKKYKTFFPILRNSHFNKLLFLEVPKDVNDFVDVDTLVEEANKNEFDKRGIEVSSISNTSTDINKFLSKNNKNVLFIFGSLYLIGWILENYTRKD